MIDQLLKSKYHATHLGIFTDNQPEIIDKLLNKAARSALGLIPSFPAEAIHWHTTEMGLGYEPMKYIVTQMGIVHITEILSKPTDRGYTAYAHTTRVANTYHHWPKEAHEATQAKLPTLREISNIRIIPGAELENIQNVESPNHIATGIRESSEAIDQHKVAQRQHIPQNLQFKGYARQHRNQCQPLRYANKLLKHMVPMWEEGASDWTQI